MIDRSNHRKIAARLDPQEAEGLGVEIENLWALPSGIDGVWRLDSIPFLVAELSLGDEILAENIDNRLFVSRKLSESGNSTIVVSAERPSDVHGIRNLLISLGCDVEKMENGILAVNIPRDVSMRVICDALDGIPGGDEITYWQRSVSTYHHEESS